MGEARQGFSFFSRTNYISYNEELLIKETKMDSNLEEEVWAEALSMVPMLAEQVYDSGDYLDNKNELYRYMADLFEAVATTLRAKRDIEDSKMN